MQLPYVGTLPVPSCGTAVGSKTEGLFLIRHSSGSIDLGLLTDKRSMHSVLDLKAMRAPLFSQESLVCDLSHGKLSYSGVLGPPACQHL